MTNARVAGEVILQDVSLGYVGKPVVEHASGTIERGALLALVGPNGAGKSTLLKAIAGLLRPMAGSIQRSAGAARAIAYMPQHNELDLSIPISLLDFVAMGLWHETGWWRPVSREQKERARRSLAQVSLAHMAAHRIGELSGGQIRRALFSRVSLQDAPIILLDEPFAGVDTATVNDLLGTIVRWHAEGRTVVAAMHDLVQVQTFFPETLLLARRVIAWGASKEVLTPDNLTTARNVCEPAASGAL